MDVPALDLQAQYAAIRDEIEAAIGEVLDSKRFILGPKVEQLERELAEYSDCAGGVAVSSGTDALLCALMTLGIGPGDEVITTPFTFFATVGSIWRTGARPVFVDIDPVTFNIDAARVADAVTDKTRAIMPVHLFGQIAEMAPILDTAGKHDLFVVEDAAQAIGATQNGRKAGSFGTAGCLSFYPSKNLGAIGDAGMVLATDPEWVEKIRIFRTHGSAKKYYHQWVGGNFRMDGIQAAALLVKFRHLEAWSAARRERASRYDALLAGIDEVTPPTVLEGNVSCVNQYVIRAERRDDLQDHLKGAGVGVAVYYPLSLHEQECFAELGYRRGDFPQSEKAAEEVLALPLYPELTDEQMQYVVDQIKAFYGKG